MDKDVIAIVHDNVIEMVDLKGQPKTTKKIGISKFEFEFKVDGMGELMKVNENLFYCSANNQTFLSQSSSKTTAFSPFTLTVCREGRCEMVPLHKKLRT